MAQLRIHECKYIDKLKDQSAMCMYDLKFSMEEVFEADQMYRDEFAVRKALDHILNNTFRKDFRIEPKSKKGKAKRTKKPDDKVLSRVTEFTVEHWTHELREACKYMLLVGYAVCKVKKGSPRIKFLDPSLYEISFTESPDGFEYACNKAHTFSSLGSGTRENNKNTDGKGFNYFIFISDHPKISPHGHKARLSSPTVALRDSYQVKKVATATYMKSIQRRAVPPYVVRVPQLESSELNGTLPLTSTANHTSAIRDRISAANDQQSMNASDIRSEIVQTMAANGLSSEQEFFKLLQQKLGNGKQEIDFFDEAQPGRYKIESMRPDAESQMVTLTAGATLENAPVPEVPSELLNLRQEFEDHVSLIFGIPPAVFSRTLDSAKKGGGITHGQLAQGNLTRTIDMHKNRVKKIVSYLFYAVFGKYYISNIFLNKARAHSRAKDGKKDDESAKTHKKGEEKFASIEEFLDNYELDTSGCSPDENEIDVIFPSDVTIANALVMMDAGVFGHKEKVQFFCDYFNMEENQFAAEDPALSQPSQVSAKERPKRKQKSFPEQDKKKTKKGKINPASTESEYRSERNMEPKIKMKQ